jgi:hypothetical protein
VANSHPDDTYFGHDRNFLRVENEQARNWYMDEAASQNWERNNGGWQSKERV